MRVHPAPFSPTPNRHAGIGLKMKGGGPGGSRFELVGLLEPQRKEHERHFGPQKEVDFLAPPVDPGVGPTKETAFSDILLLFCAISATERGQ